MRRMFLMAAMTMLSLAASAMSLAEARGGIDKVIENPKEMTAVMKQLAVEDQKSFVADVNEAIIRLPGGLDEKTSKIVDVNRAALRGAAAKDKADELRAVLAVIFATVPVESLCVLNEIFAKNVLNRAADPTRTYTDENFTKIAKSVVEAVVAKTAGIEDADVRAGFAALMMIRASNGTPASLSDELAAMLGKSAAVAKEEWFPGALRDPSDYDAILASTAAMRAPDSRMVLAIAGAQRHEALLDAFYSGDVNSLDAVAKGLGDVSQIQSFDHDIHTRPRTMEPLPWNPDGGTDQPGPKPYYGQEID